ncbi:ABC transporter ATP-binding protein [Fodinicola acaciae]|uniref:ABC transporter ATP-binding protein n=1 Tax=Fodinicola acaciae TaxID=2681555 RepID=UPI0013D795F3|nr:ABC transporter ATP-binding protein [Fodinicola acaciae]
MKVEISGLSVALSKATVLRDVDVSVPAGSWLGLIGPNGAGKSTLLRALLGLVPSTGRILLGGKEIGSLRARERARLVAYAPQSPLLPTGMSVLDYTLLGRTPYQSLLGAPGRSDRVLADGILRRLDLDGLGGRPLQTLSGGERQRVVLARALAQQPSLLLLDEPTASLDLGHAQAVLELVDRLRVEDGITVVSALHDLSLAAQYPVSLVLLAGGSVVATGRPSAVLTAESLATYYSARVAVDTGPTGLPRITPLRR